MKLTTLLLFFAALLSAADPKPLTDKEALEISRLQTFVNQLKADYAETYARALQIEGQLKDRQHALLAAVEKARETYGAKGCSLKEDGKSWQCAPPPDVKK